MVLVPVGVGPGAHEHAFTGPAEDAENLGGPAVPVVIYGLMPRLHRLRARIIRARLA
ncbi:hypothetical protein [Paractinoplanes brasiliensis]|uniref:Uncharacterized protein n=1 Tax=Paractinoplanes brasiliensis TaxID=52695 RepID=A0A4R6JKI1_9ACTN|nr:hypothetical protein [Actinoplanes brasiliensis]TDO36744.1 hypothetical protein C8E87_0326 [Actinoplanes brasiliensis]GID32382.1 hypothetical protein Abr02nite_73650 [Actinoplanes brasiliensis]